jgi:acetyl-CoA synthetase
LHQIPWPGIARTIWEIISVIKTLIFSVSRKFFTGDGALRDEVGYYRITGRVDVVIVSGITNSSIEDSINEHPTVY